MKNIKNVDETVLVFLFSKLLSTLKKNDNELSNPRLINVAKRAPIIKNNSFIHRCLYKQQSKKFHDLLYKAMPNHANSFQLTNKDTTLLSYYEGGDYYHEHIDLFNFTCLIWFHKQPKKYTGGDFYLPGPNKIIESKHNRLLIIPSYYKHGVTELKMNNKLKIGSGRYTITHFYFNYPFVEVKNV